MILLVYPLQTSFFYVSPSKQVYYLHSTLITDTLPFLLRDKKWYYTVLIITISSQFLATFPTIAGTSLRLLSTFKTVPWTESIIIEIITVLTCHVNVFSLLKLGYLMIYIMVYIMLYIVLYIASYMMLYIVSYIMLYIVLYYVLYSHLST